MSEHTAGEVPEPLFLLMNETKLGRGIIRAVYVDEGTKGIVDHTKIVFEIVGETPQNHKFTVTVPVRGVQPLVDQLKQSVTQGVSDDEWMELPDRISTSLDGPALGGYL